MADLGTAYVQIVPAATGIKGKISQALSPEATAAGKSAGRTVAQNLGSSVSSLGGKMMKAGMIATAVSVPVIAGIKKAMSAYEDQALAETKLTEIYRSRMGATKEAAQATIDYAGALQKQGVVGDEVTIAGAQQLATFAKMPKTVNSLLPAMQNLLVQQKGLNGTQQDATQIANLMGKVMQGQTGALKRVGISFTDAEEKVLKYGTEQERAAMLAQVITNNVGDMNKAMLDTPSGKIQQMKNSFGDLAEEIGATLAPALADMAKYISANIIPKVQKLISFIQGHPMLGKIALGITGLLAVGGPLLTLIGGVTKGIGGLISMAGKSGGIGGIIGKAVGGVGGAGGTGGGGGVKGTLTGLANAAILVTGVTGLVVALGALRKVPHFDEFIKDGGKTLGDVFNAVKKVANPQMLATFAAIEGMGMLGVGTAVSGIASLATMLGGITVLVTAFGALDKIPGIKKFMEGGGDLIATIMKQVGRAVGAVAEGFAVEISSGLPAIGENLAGFANNSKPFFDMAANADFSGMDGFADGIMTLVKADLGNKLSEFLFGSGYDFEAIGKELSKFANAMIEYFAYAQAAGDTSAGIQLMKSAGEISTLVEATKNWEAGWGEANLAGLGKALTQYASEVKPFFDKAKEITDLEGGIKLMSVAGKISKLVKAAKAENQIGQMGMKDLAHGLTAYAKEMVSYFKTAAGITDMSAGLDLASKSGQINKLTTAARDYKAGSLSKLGSELNKFAKSYKEFSENMSGTGEVDVSGATNTVNKLASGLSGSSDALSKALKSIGKGATSAFAGIKNTFTSGANSIAKAADFSSKVKTSMNKVNTALSSAKGTIKKNLDSIKNLFSKVKFDMKHHISLPHFSMSGSFDAKKKKTPKVNVSWYAKGFIVDNPTLIGAGEAGPEALLPLNPFWDKMDAFANNLQGGNTFNITLNANGGEDPEQYAQRFARELHRQVRMGAI